MVLFILLAIVWYVIGVASFIYWWTYSFDYTPGIACLSLIVGLIGPFAFPVGMFIHSDSYPQYNCLGQAPHTLIRKRTRPRSMDARS